LGFVEQAASDVAAIAIIASLTAPWVLKLVIATRASPFVWG
jgi:hypothetical protein